MIPHNRGSSLPPLYSSALSVCFPYSLPTGLSLPLPPPSDSFRKFQVTHSQHCAQHTGGAPGLPPSVQIEVMRKAFSFFFLKKLFIYLWLCWAIIGAHELSLVAASGGYSSLRCRGFSSWWLLVLQNTGSRHVGFRRCGP